MQKQESKFAIKFRHWLMANPMATGAFEIKDTRGKKAFPLREWKEEQRNYAEAIKYSKKGVLIRTEGVAGLHDYVYLRNAYSWVVINYPEGFCIVDSETLNLQKKKSLNFLELSDLSHTTVKY